MRSASASFAAERGPLLALIVDYIDEHNARFGVEPICTVLTS